MAKFDLHQSVTDDIVAALEAGAAPWVKPWASAPGGVYPHNMESGRRYNGINVFLLSMVSHSNGWGNEWATFSGIKRMGGKVRKGERHTKVVYVTPVFDKDDEDKILYFRTGYHRVWNRAQTEGLPAPEPVEPTEFNPHDDAERIIQESGATIKEGGEAALYRIDADEINLPDRTRFKDSGAYYSTALHELIHWTGHSSRLGRDLRNPFGSEEYAKEELVAELGAAFLCAEIGMDGTLQHPEYIASWIKVLKNDKRAIFKASADASKAAALLNPSEDDE